MPELDLSKLTKDTSWFDPSKHLFVTARNARAHFSRVVSAASGERIIVTVHGEPAVAFVSIKDLERLRKRDMLIARFGRQQCREVLGLS